MSYNIPADFKKENQSFLDIKESDDKEVFLIRVPKGFDISKLHGTEFSSSEIQELEVEETGSLSTVYELETFSGQGLDVSPLIKTKGKTALGPPVSGFLAVKKTYEVNPKAPHRRVHRVIPPGPVPMPEGLKVRFTPFGSGLPVKTATDVAQKKKKKKRKHSGDEDTSASSPDSLRMNKKRKLEDNLESMQHSVKKQKKSKKLDLGLDSVGSPQRHSVNDSIGGRYFSSGIADSINNNSPSTESEGSRKHKKHKKDKSSLKESSFGEQSFKGEGNSTIEMDEKGERKSKKVKDKSKLKVSFDDSVFIDRTENPKHRPLPDIVKELPDNPSVLGETSSHLVNGDTKHKKSKKKHSSGYGSVDTSMDSSLLDVDYEHTKKKKKKKKHKHEVD